jgi:hypothetical protein
MLIESIHEALSCADPFNYEEVQAQLALKGYMPIGASMFAGVMGRACMALSLFPDSPLALALEQVEDYSATKYMEEMTPYLPPPIIEETPIATPVEQVTSAVTAASHFIASGFTVLAKEDRQARLDICLDCFEEDVHVLTNGRCKYCGCFMSIKTWLPAEKCPKGRW